MNLLYITKELPFGAAEAFIYAELAQMQALGHQITIVPVRKAELSHAKGRALLPQTLAMGLASPRILMGAARGVLRQPMAVLRALSATVTWSRPRLIPRNAAVWMKAIWLAEEVRRRGIDHIHVHWIAVPATMAMIAARLSGVPFSITAHRYDIAQGNLIPQKFAAARFVRAIDGPGVAELVAQCLPGQLPPVLIRMGVDLPDQSVELQSGPLDRLRGAIGARFIAKKGHATLIRAVQIARASGLDLQIDLFGEGPLEAELKAQVAAAGLQDAIRFCGVASHDVLQASLASGTYDFAVLPSVTAADGDKEGIPVFLMEAMALGLPVIATPNGGIAELIGPEDGLLVPEYDAEALARAMQQLAGSGDLRQAIARNGRIKVRSQFSIAACARQLQNLMGSSAGQPAETHSPETAGL